MYRCYRIILCSTFATAGIYIMRCIAHCIFDVFNPDVVSIMPNLFSIQVADMLLAGAFVQTFGVLVESHEALNN